MRIIKNSRRRMKFTVQVNGDTVHPAGLSDNGIKLLTDFLLLSRQTTTDVDSGNRQVRHNVQRSATLNAANVHRYVRLPIIKLIYRQNDMRQSDGRTAFVSAC